MLINPMGLVDRCFSLTIDQLASLMVPPCSTLEISVNRSDQGDHSPFHKIEPENEPFMKKKRTAAHLNESDDKTERCVKELTAELARTKEKLATLSERLNLESEKYNLAEQRHADRLGFETLLTELSARFVNLPAKQIDTAIEDAQRRICECLGIDLSALGQWSDEAPHFLTVTHLHAPPDGGVDRHQRTQADGRSAACAAG
jgi:hypothetical protein